MASASDYLEDAILNHITGNNIYTPSGALYLALFDDSASSITLEQNLLTGEVSGNGYTRKSIVFGSSSGGVSLNTSIAEFNQATGPWGIVTYVCICDTFENGNILFHAPLSIPRDISAGDTFRFLANNLGITVT